MELCDVTESTWAVVISLEAANCCGASDFRSEIIIIVIIIIITIIIITIMIMIMITIINTIYIAPKSKCCKALYRP